MNLFEVAAKISLDSSEYEKGLDNAKENASSFGEKLKSGLGTAAKIGGAALTAAATGIALLTKNLIENYAEYEQLVGGVETLFKDSAGKVQEYAFNAYKTAGMSANEYMTTVTSFSASLLQSLGGDTVKAAEKANLAVTDMSDNANKMGTSIESIQNAYQGFAKQNYTMLDNLKLGYGGTKEEMQRLLKDAEELSGQKFNLSSYSDIVDAIHIVQTEMGITGTTANEAASTIQGSIGMMKGAWTNLVTGMTDEKADVGELMGQFVDSIVTVGQNVIPAIQRVLPNIVKGLEKLVTAVSEKLPELINEILPQLLETAVGLVNSLIGALPEMLNTLLPPVMNGTISIILAVANALPGIFMVIVDVLPTLIQSLVSVLPTLLPVLIKGVIDMIVYLAEHFEDIINPLINTLPDIIMSVVNALMNNLPALINGVVALVIGIVNSVDKIITVLVDMIPTIISGIVAGLAKAFPTVIKAVIKLITEIPGKVAHTYSKLAEIGTNMVKGLWNGIKDVAGWLWDKVKGVCNKLVNKVKDFFGIKSPSKLFAGFGKFLDMGLALGIESNAGIAVSAMQKLSEGVAKAFNIDTTIDDTGIPTVIIPDPDYDGDGNLRKPAGGVQVIQNIYSQAKTAADEQQEAMWYAERAVLTGV